VKHNPETRVASRIETARYNPETERDETDPLLNVSQVAKLIALSRPQTRGIIARGGLASNDDGLVRRSEAHRFARKALAEAGRSSAPADLVAAAAATFASHEIRAVSWEES
jgi:hypothetical protein